MAKRQHSAIVEGGVITAELLDFATGQVQALQTDGASDNTPPPPAWIVRNLLKYGELVYVPDGDPLAGWYLASGHTIVDRYTRPLTVYARTQATNQTVLPLQTVFGGGNARILRANPASRPPLRTMERYGAFITACDVALYANITASMRTQVLGAPAKMRDTLECVLDDARRGMPTILTDDQLAQISSTDVSVPFAGADIHNLRKDIYAEAIKHFGGITPAQYKAERVQAAEVGAHVAESIDNVYIMIDTFNEDAATQGVPWRLKYVGMGAQYDNDTPATSTEEDGQNDQS